ncbi:sugar transferase [Priestia endophytica]|uniref:sugar transferase n=1 Tax=Priestia endophytica TaxID=135735 RepID=UPI003D2C67EC
MSDNVTKKKIFNSEQFANSERLREADRQPYTIYRVCKRVIDVVGALIGLILTLPIFIVISFLYLFGENKGPIFYRQQRIGKNGGNFNILKFRSMIVDAETVLKSDKHLYQKYLKNNYKLEPEEDPRITNVGRILRKTSLDELPQLINVLKGDMSLVGPRPVIQEELKEYNARLADFLAVKPGVTGYWQICGRSDVGYPERAELEFYYIDHYGIKLDTKILIGTVLLVITRRGAY